MFNFIVHLLIMTGIFSILSLSLNFQVGISGMINFGHVAFLCIGAYTSALLLVFTNLPFVIVILCAFLVSGFFGFLIAIPTRKLGDTYWAITTLGSAEIVRLFFLNEQWVVPGDYAGGPFGISGIPRPLHGIISRDYYSLFYLFIVLFLVVLTLIILNYLTRSPFGRVLKAIRDDEELPLALGKDVYWFKIKSMIIGGSFAGIAGTLLASYSTYIDPQFFMPIETFIIWAMIIVGGKGNFYGVILGTLVVRLFYDTTRFLPGIIPLSTELFSSLRMVIIGLLIVVFMLYKEEGLLKEKKVVY